MSVGFTLVELLAAIGVVALLVGLGYPTLQAGLQRARKATCLGNMRQIAMATLAYAGDNEMSLPTYKSPAIDVKLAPYLGTKLAAQTVSPANPCSPVWKCPADPRPLVMQAATGIYARSYTFSACSYDPLLRGVIGDGTTYPSLRLTQIVMPSKTILLYEWFFGSATNNVQYSAGWASTGGWTTAAGIPQSSGGSFSHGKTVDLAFCDAHAESLDPHVVYQTNPTLWMPTVVLPLAP